MSLSYQNYIDTRDDFCCSGSGSSNLMYLNNFANMDEQAVKKLASRESIGIFIAAAAALIKESSWRGCFEAKIALAASLVQLLTSSFLAAVNQTRRRCGLMVIGGKTREDRSRVSSTSSESLSDGQMTCGRRGRSLSRRERHCMEKKAHSHYGSSSQGGKDDDDDAFDQSIFLAVTSKFLDI